MTLDATVKQLSLLRTSMLKAYFQIDTEQKHVESCIIAASGSRTAASGPGNPFGAKHKQKKSTVMDDAIQNMSEDAREEFRTRLKDIRAEHDAEDENERVQAEQMKGKEEDDEEGTDEKESGLTLMNVAKLASSLSARDAAFTGTGTAAGVGLAWGAVKAAIDNPTGQKIIQKLYDTSLCRMCTPFNLSSQYRAATKESDKQAKIAKRRSVEKDELILALQNTITSHDEKTILLAKRQELVVQNADKQEKINLAELKSNAIFKEQLAKSEAGDAPAKNNLSLQLFITNLASQGLIPQGPELVNAREHPIDVLANLTFVLQQVRGCLAYIFGNAAGLRYSYAELGKFVESTNHAISRKNVHAKEDIMVIGKTFTNPMYRNVKATGKIFNCYLKDDLLRMIMQTETYQGITADGTGMSFATQPFTPSLVLNDNSTKEGAATAKNNDTAVFENAPPMYYVDSSGTERSPESPNEDAATPTPYKRQKLSPSVDAKQSSENKQGDSKTEDKVMGSPFTYVEKKVMDDWRVHNGPNIVQYNKGGVIVKYGEVAKPVLPKKFLEHPILHPMLEGEDDPEHRVFITT